MMKLLLNLLLLPLLRLRRPLVPSPPLLPPLLQPLLQPLLLLLPLNRSPLPKDYSVTDGFWQRIC